MSFDAYSFKVAWPRQSAVSEQLAMACIGGVFGMNRRQHFQGNPSLTECWILCTLNLISELSHTWQSYLIALINHCMYMLLLLSVVGFQPVGRKGKLERPVASYLAAGLCLGAWQLKIICVFTHPFCRDWIFGSHCLSYIHTFLKLGLGVVWCCIALFLYSLPWSSCFHDIWSKKTQDGIKPTT